MDYGVRKNVARKSAPKKALRNKTFQMTDYSNATDMKKDNIFKKKYQPVMEQK